MATLGAGRPDQDRFAPHLQEVVYRRRGPYERYFKRPLDVVVAALLLAALTPLAVIIAALVRWRVGSPVIYAQSRVGIGGEQFKMYKFRTMIPDRRTDSMNFEGPDRRLVHKSPDDPRVLPFGRLLRRLSLDELPQLWNVVNGDMSLVGPRPELPEIVAEYDYWQHARHAVKPGITCLWQIWSREELLKESTDLDLRYVDSISFLGDLKILLATPAAALLQKNGY